MATLNRQQEPESIEEVTLLKTVDVMRKRLSSLQQEIDRVGEEWMNSFTVSSASEAQEARNFFDKNWFAKALYSAELKQRIAQMLIEAVTPYPFVDRSVWEAMAKVN